RRDKPAVLRNRQTRNQFDGALDGDSFETCQMSGLTKITVDTARKRHPRVELVFKTFDAAKEMRAPKFAFACLESQRLERDRDLDVETGLVNDAFRFHQQIDAEVFAATFGDNAVALNSERIEEDLKRFALVVEGIEHEADVVVVENVVALRDRGADSIGLVSSFECDVEELRIETEQDFGWF